MVDLLQQYRDAGLELSAKELPDYIPLFLEYLATREEDEAAQGLGDVHPILALLSARLQERESAYHLLFDALLAMINIQPDMTVLRDKAAAEPRDDTAAAMDKVWEEEMVNFVEDKGASCRPTQSTNQTHTLHFREN
jgi:nitrate reductase delta subunit